MPIARATRTPAPTIGTVKGFDVSCVATSIHKMKHPTAMTMPPTREATLRFVGGRSELRAK
jgi:hypothetical protein